MATDLHLCNYDPIKSKVDGQKHRFKQVNQYDQNKVFINSFISIMDASRKTNINSGSISNACNRKYPTAGGYYWFFANDKNQFDKSCITLNNTKL